MLRFIFILVNILYATNTNAQTLQQIAPLVPPITEASGLQFINEDTMLIHNDSGDGPWLFWMNKMGVVLDSIELPITAIDWEDLTSDDKGNFYIGDFGNNFNNRQNLAIHRWADFGEMGDSLNFSTISFSYPDQTSFPPSPAELNFDCEAMVHVDNFLFLFSKNRGTSSHTKCYQLPDTAGDYQAILIDSFDTGGWVTGATFNEEEKQLVLLSEMFIWVFYDFEGTDFFGGKSKQILFEFSKKEGAAFDIEGNLWMVDDSETTAFQGYLWKMEGPLVGTVSVPINQLSIYPNPVSRFLFINTAGLYLEPNKQFQLYNFMGKMVLENNIVDDFQAINIHHLNNGMYYYRLGNYEGKMVIQK